jgi:hypothetical protein
MAADCADGGGDRERGPPTSSVDVDRAALDARRAAGDRPRGAEETRPALPPVLCTVVDTSKVR